MKVTTKIMNMKKHAPDHHEQEHSEHDHNHAEHNDGDEYYAVDVEGLSAYIFKLYG